MNYTVKVKTVVGATEEKLFKSYREALCYATNYAQVKASQVIKGHQLINDFKF